MGKTHKGEENFLGGPTLEEIMGVNNSKKCTNLNDICFKDFRPGLTFYRYAGRYFRKLRIVQERTSIKAIKIRANMSQIR